MHSDAGEKQISTVGYKIQATIQRGWTHLQVLQEKWRSLRHGINAIYSFFIMTLVSGGRWLEQTGVFSIIPGDNKKKGQYVIFRLSYVGSSKTRQQLAEGTPGKWKGSVRNLTQRQATYSDN